MAKAIGAVSLGVSALIVIAIILIVGFGVFLSSTLNGSSTTRLSSSLDSSTITNSSQTSLQGTTFTASVGQPNIPAGCINVAGGQGEGYVLNIYLPNQATIGDSICMETSVQNVANHSTNLIPFEQTINITDQSGKVVFFRTMCALTMTTAGNFSFSVGQSATCTSNWNTSVPYDGMLAQASRYNFLVTVEFGTLKSPNLYSLSDQAMLDLLPLSYTRTIACNYGYTTMTESVIVNSNTTTTVGSTGPATPPANDTTAGGGICTISGP